MVKVLFLIHDLGQGGAEKVLVNLVNHIDLTKFDISVTALFGGGVNEQFLRPEIKYKIIFKKCFPGNSHLMKLLSPEKLHDLIVKEDYDIEISYLEGPSARVISGCRNKNTKLVSWIHTDLHTRRGSAGSFRNYSESVKCYKKFNKTVCVSETVKEDFLKLYPSTTDAIVLYNTNETDGILKLKDEPVEDEIFREGEFKLCGVGKIVPNKGFDRLAKVHKRLWDDGYPVHTYILGEGFEREKIEEYLSDNQIENSFTFLGYQSNPYKYVTKCDLFVCASYTEGFSTAATEALILGIPVVTTPVAGMDELLRSDKACGIITEQSEDSLYESIKKLLKDSNLLEYYKENAILRGMNFKTDVTVRRVEEMLENI